MYSMTSVVSRRAVKLDPVGGELDVQRKILLKLLNIVDTSHNLLNLLFSSVFRQKHLFSSSVIRT